MLGTTLHSPFGVLPAAGWSGRHVFQGRLAQFLWSVCIVYMAFPRGLHSLPVRSPWSTGTVSVVYRHGFHNLPAVSMVGRFCTPLVGLGNLSERLPGKTGATAKHEQRDPIEPASWKTERRAAPIPAAPQMPRDARETSRGSSEQSAVDSANSLELRGEHCPPLKNMNRK